jgi:hypothetical protein
VLLLCFDADDFAEEEVDALLLEAGRLFFLADFLALLAGLALPDAVAAPEKLYPPRFLAAAFAAVFCVLLAVVVVDAVVVVM